MYAFLRSRQIGTGKCAEAVRALPYRRARLHASLGGRNAPRKNSEEWSAYAAASGTLKVCFAVSQPKQMTPRRSSAGRFTSISRGGPADNVANEVSVKMGYPFGDGAKATLTVGTPNSDLFTKDEGAFVEKTDAETKLIRL